MQNLWSYLGHNCIKYRFHGFFNLTFAIWPNRIWKCSKGPKRANNSRRLVILTKHPLPKQINERSLFDSNLYKPRLANNAVHILIKGIYSKYSKHWPYTVIVCAENVKSWFKSWVFPFTFQAYILPHTLYCMCVSLFKFHIWILKQF